MISKEKYFEPDIQMAAVMESAPPPIVDAMPYINRGDFETAARIIDMGLLLIMNFANDWAGSAVCCKAYCLKQIGNFNEAVEIAIIGKKYGLNMCGYWYYYKTMVDALNQLDELNEALSTANEGIEYWNMIGPTDSGEVCAILSAKANILKQIAVKYENIYKEKDLAKHAILESIRSMCESLSISTLGWELDIGERELQYIGNIAKRLEVTADDVRYIDSLNDEVKSIVGKCFGPIIFE